MKSSEPCQQLLHLLQAFLQCLETSNDDPNYTVYTLVNCAQRYRFTSIFEREITKTLKKFLKIFSAGIRFYGWKKNSAFLYFDNLHAFQEYHIK